MSSRCRYVDGDTNLQDFIWDSTYPIERGDLCYLHPATNKVRPASALNAEGSQELDQLAFASYFVGVAQEKVGLQSGETTFRQDQNARTTVLIATTGRFEFDCPAQAFASGQPVGVYSASGAGCSNQKVDALKGSATLSAAIGRAFLTTGALKVQNASGTMNRVVVDILGRRIMGTAPVAGTYSGTSGV